MKYTLSIIIILILVIALPGWSGSAETYFVGFNNIIIKQIFRDGVTIAVHYRPEDLKKYHSDPHTYAGLVFNYAVGAYNEIVHRQGFNTPGFTYANPDKNYCYDKDKTIDIYIAEGGKDKKGLGDFSGADFIDSPSYDIIKGEDTDYDAVILFPADYEGYLVRWGSRDFSGQEIDERLSASLHHEMFHIISYSYNKNVKPWYNQGNKTSSYQGGDWYVEGLARYFETIAGSYGNFFSKGFVKKEADKLTIFQGGVNYLMEHPDESLKDARYNYALFWAYLHKRYSMERIEEISRRLRFISKEGIKEELPFIISLSLKENFEDVLGGFAVAMYFKHFNPNIKKGLSRLKIMSLDDFLINSEKRLSSWASNFITLNLVDKTSPGYIEVQKSDENGQMRMNVFCRFQNGEIAHIRKVAFDNADTLCGVDLHEMKKIGVKEVILIITNVDAEGKMFYKLVRSAY